MIVIKRIALFGALAAVLIGGLLIFVYDVIKIDWVSFMEIQPSFKPMENPLAVPAASIPIEGAAYIPGMGAPANPVPADEISLSRGMQLYDVHCALCHGRSGQGDGIIGPFLQNREPAILTGGAVQTKSDGALFLTVSNGVSGAMPALNENLNVRERWDVVNYLRTLTSP
jgi:mono/diheme cytochrome c family protein